MKVNKRNGISLIVLVITIIIMIILAGAIILSLSETGLVSNANKGAFQNDISAMQDELDSYITNSILKYRNKYKKESLYADKDSLQERESVVDGKNIKSIVTSINDKYLDEIEIVNGRIRYVGNDLKKNVWANEILYGIRGKELKNSTSDGESVVFEESANLNLENYRIYGNSQVDETEKIQSVGDYVVDLDLDNKWIQGHISGKSNYYDNRIRLANYIESITGEIYKISSNLPDNMQIIVYNGTFTTYPFSDSEVIYNSEWTSEENITFTSEVDGNITIGIRYKDDSNISPEDIKDYDVGIKIYNTKKESGKYEIPMTLSGKNLIDLNKSMKSTITSNGLTATRQGDEVRVFGTRNNTSSTYAGLSFEFSYNNATKLKKGVTYKASTSSNYSRDIGVIQLSVYGSDKNWIINMNHGNNWTYTATEDCWIRHAQFVITTTEAIDIKVKIQLEEGNKATDYEPYVNDRYSIYLDEPLRKVDNYVDYIDFRKQEIVRNVEEVDGELRGLSTPVIEKISLPNILLSNSVNKLNILTSVTPSKIEAIHYTE